jgi:alpha-glucan,water dikinase
MIIALILFKVSGLKKKMQDSGMPWPGDEGEQRWEQAWTAIKKVHANAS